MAVFRELGAKDVGIVGMAHGWTCLTAVTGIRQEPPNLTADSFPDFIRE
jgi:hypothetical protein